MAARRGKPKSQARRGGGSRVPGWAWLLAGVALGLGLSVFILLREGLDGRGGGPVPNPQAQPPAAATDAAVAPEPERPRRPRYDFYTILREQETAIPDRELAERARAEAQAADAAAQASQPPPEAPASERYQLQAGAFREPNDAEAMKARLALLGLFARVQSDTINGAVWHRVRLGPYASARELEAAKQQLSSNGIEAMAVREQVR